LNRLSEQVPVSSDSIPLISVYYIVCFFFSLTSMVWFAFLNNLKVKEKKRNSIRRKIKKKKIDISVFKYGSMDDLTTNRTDELTTVTQIDLKRLEKNVFFIFCSFIISNNILLLIVFPILIIPPLLIEH
jgi:hypothetical protein